MLSPWSSIVAADDSPLVASWGSSMLSAAEETTSCRHADRRLRDFLGFLALFLRFFVRCRSTSSELLHKGTRGALDLFRFLLLSTFSGPPRSGRGGSKAECHELESSSKSRTLTPAITAARTSRRLQQNGNLSSKVAGKLTMANAD